MATASQIPLDGLAKRIHGKPWTYRKGCRCICCCAAYRDVKREEERRRKEKDPESYNALKREQARRFRASHPGYRSAENEASRKRRKALDPEKYRAAERAQQERRKVRLARGEIARHTAADEILQFWRQKGRCFYNRRHSLANGYHVDHVVPVSGDDPNGHDGKDNIVLACPRCNLSKGGTHPMHFAGMMF